MSQGRIRVAENICNSPLIDSSEGLWMKLGHVLISYRVRLDGGRRWAKSRPAYRYSLRAVEGAS